MPRGGAGKRYPEGFKRSAVEMALQKEQNISQIARDLDIHPKTLYGWVHRYRKEHHLIATDKKEDNLQAELKCLRKENVRLTMKRDILKKATAYFAKETL
ncbi:MAG: hypothetical protein DSZ03_05200 [Sulfurimonas sp.]|nr:MAG: hypothetical protein DSZ03_05200 [Sulfurimonas sp.]